MKESSVINFFLVLNSFIFKQSFATHNDINYVYIRVGKGMMKFFTFWLGIKVFHQIIFPVSLDLISYTPETYVL